MKIHLVLLALVQSTLANTAIHRFRLDQTTEPLARDGAETLEPLKLVAERLLPSTARFFTVCALRPRVSYEVRVSWSAMHPVEWNVESFTSVDANCRLVRIGVVAGGESLLVSPVPFTVVLDELLFGVQRSILSTIASLVVLLGVGAVIAAHMHRVLESVVRSHDKKTS